MLRLLLLVALAAAPLVASAHGGHHEEKAAADTESRASIAVSAPCAPSGGGEMCSCHNLSCLSHFHPAALLHAPMAGCALQSLQSPIASLVGCTLPPAPFVRFPPRGPPRFS
jgi:hypothetical protein